MNETNSEKYLKGKETNFKGKDWMKNFSAYFLDETNTFNTKP